MRIVVCVKHVPDPLDPVELSADLRIDRHAMAGMLSTLDEYAVDQAVRLGGKKDSVIALSMGPTPARSAVTRALQMGADEGVLVTDESLAGADALTTAQVLASAVAKIGDVDLVVCGMSSTDGATGTVPVLIGDILGQACASHARAIQLDGVRVIVERDDPDGVRTLAATLPAVVSVTDQSGEPEYPSFKGILAAKRRKIREMTLTDLGLTSPISTTMRTVSASPTPPRPPATIVTDTSGSGAAALAEFLLERGVKAVL
ncbi:MAG: electron transfer flavoprotein subunit beta/FixA family protein [Arachnia sp.]